MVKEARETEGRARVEVRVNVMPNRASASNAEPLSARDLELLGRVKARRLEAGVPGEVRERLLRRVLEDARRSEQSLAVPAAQFVAVPPRGLAFGLGWGAALACGLILLTQLRGWLRADDAGEDPLLAGEAATGEAATNGGGAEALARGERVFQSALFRAPAPAFSGALPAPESSLFGERPFSAQSAAWQVRRWDDLKSDPTEPAKYELVGGGMCVDIGDGERVVGGWPWLGSGIGSGSSGPKRVALAAGGRYRLVFRAWSREPLPAQVLIAVGHDQVPFSASAAARVDVSTTPRAFALSFVAAHHDPSVGVAFLATAAADAERTELCLSDVTLTEAPAR
jgi:hypothetical protein